MNTSLDTDHATAAGTATGCGWLDTLFLLRGRRLSRPASAYQTMEGAASC